MRSFIFYAMGMCTPARPSCMAAPRLYFQCRCMRWETLVFQSSQHGKLRLACFFELP